MTEKLYLIDGINYPEQEVKSLLQSNKIGKREELVLSMINNPDENKTIVDLGCLYGAFSKQLKNIYSKSNIIAGDYLEEHLAISRLLHPEIASIYQKLDAYNLDLDSDSVDILLFQEVIEHLEGAALAIKEINRVLKIGGELILTTPTAYYWKDMWQAFKYELVRKYKRKNLKLSDSIYFEAHEWNRHIYCWTPSTLYTLLKVNGFDYITHDYCKEGRGRIEKFFLKCFPFLSPTIVIKVSKQSQAQKRIV